MALATNLGFPRIGAKRELKRLLEQYWKGKITESDLQNGATRQKQRNWQWQIDAGIDVLPVNDFSLYDHVLDTAVLMGAIPERFQSNKPLETYFAMARGNAQQPALEMTKWFNTNYHYIVPQWAPDQQFQLNSEQLLEDIRQAQSFHKSVRPIVLGPVSLLLLGKQKLNTNPLDLLPRLLPVYQQLFEEISNCNVGHLQLDEPVLATDLFEESRRAISTSCQALAESAPGIQITLASYFDGLRDNLALALSQPVAAVHLDLVSDSTQLQPAINLASKLGRALSLGLVNGRNVWKTDLRSAITLAEQAVNRLGTDRVLIAPSCSLLHTPVDLSVEKNMQSPVKSWLAFARQKLDEIRLITQAVNHGRQTIQAELTANSASIESRRSSNSTASPAVRRRTAAVTDSDGQRMSNYETRRSIQAEHLKLPILPTTTIGSFPQTRDVRKARGNLRTGRIDQQQYDQFVETATKQCINRQQSIGLDVLVHGEFERNDMVEYFGHQLDGVCVTQFGWVQSYGSRCVKPPIIFGDVSRPEPMTQRWTQFAQSQTDKIVKGMLTGPVTILCWSFVRDDQPRSATCQQIALAIRDEVLDLETAGIRIIQIDEPALREGLPLRTADHLNYLKWATDAFRLASAGVQDATQIHTHMCYCEFHDILNAIVRLDADVISIETSRSNMELLNAFAQFEYPNEIGPGVYDIHSPRVPSQNEIVELLRRAAHVIPLERLWVNPDCGLKTRDWPETEQALKAMVQAAKQCRMELACVEK